VFAVYSPSTTAPASTGAPGGFQKSIETEIDLDAFDAEGRAIARAVKTELPDWSIVYFDEAEAARPKYEGPPTRFEVEIQ
jgi:hypothetical protein